jgi:glutamate-1-semialdehyde 2,1-aminomutase
VFEGCHIWDEDGNKYIDFCCSWGPLILGHNHQSVKSTVFKAMGKGMSFGAPTQKENELASLIVEKNEYLDKIRFVNSGTEAVMSAIRLARGYTNRDKIIKFDGCYHGHADSLLVKAGSGLATLGVSSSEGVPDSTANETIVLELNDKESVLEAFENYPNEIACIIIEPVPANNGLLIQDQGYLQFLRDACSKNGALLIFDEVISGFRLDFCGAAAFYNVQPDLITYGKIIGGGLPVGAYGGKEDVMSCISPDGNVYPQP